MSRSDSRRAGALAGARLRRGLHAAARRGPRELVLITVVCVALAGVGGTGSATATGSATGCGPAWKTVTSPSVSQGSEFSAVRALATDDVWAAGAASTNGLLHPLAEHWDGTAWSVAPTPSGGSGESVFNGLAALSSSDVWAVGWHGPTGLAEHWDGSRWQVVPGPSVAGGDNLNLIDVGAIGPADVWAVGTYRRAATVVALAEHWNGTAWQLVPVQNPGTNGNALLAIAGAGAHDVWAVGYKRGTGPYRPLVEHWDGSQWSAVTAAVPPQKEDAVLTGVATLAGAGAWAVGYQVVQGVTRSLVEHWNGTSWSIVRSDDRQRVAILRAVVPISPTDIWAVGVAHDDGAGMLQPLIEHSDGATWSSVLSPRLPSDGELFALEAAPGSGQLWAVGAAHGGRRPLLETVCVPSGDTAAAPAAPSSADPRLPAVRTNRVQRSMTGSAFAMSSTPRRTRSVPIVAEDMAGPAGIAQTVESWSAVVADFNSDGWSDLFLGRHQGPASLYRNGNGVFTELSTGISRIDRHGCASADINGDGLPDLFCVAGADQGTGTKENQLELQLPDGSFVDHTIDYGLADPLGRGRQIAFLDANGDGRPDLYLGDDTLRTDSLPSPGRLLLNVNGKRFRDAPEFGIDIRSVGCAQAADYNNDGWQDLLVCDGLGAASTTRLYRNNAGHGFTEVTAGVGITGLSTDAELVDLNGDGWLDLVQISPGRLSVSLQQGGTFQSGTTMPLTAGRSVAVGDVNAA